MGISRIIRPDQAPTWLAVAFGPGLLGHALGGAGLYWDVAWHVDVGRDEQLLTPPHLLIVAGLLLVTLAALAGLAVARREGARLPRSLIAAAASGGVALLGFPLDELWHRANGIDVTLWSPTHLLMVCGGALAAVPLWLALGEAGVRAADSRWARASHLLAAMTVLGGLSALQGEFDFGVPQFQLLYHPVLVVGSGAFALTAARAVLGRGGAVATAGLFLVVRSALALAATSATGRTMPRVALYLGVALAVELGMALRPPERGPLPSALLAGVAAGTIGLGGEWAWAALTARHGWTRSLLPEAVLLAVAIGIGGALLGVAFAAGLRERVAFPRPPALAVAALLVLVALALPAPRSGELRPQVALSFTPAAGETTDLRLIIGPPDAPYGARWWEVLAWQGGGVRIIPLRPGPNSGEYLATEPVPVGGRWKSMLRLHRGAAILAAPLRRPADAEAGQEAVEPVDRFVTMEPETVSLGGGDDEAPGWLGGLVLAMVGLLAAAWSLLVVHATRAARSVIVPPAGARARARAAG